MKAVWHVALQDLRLHLAEKANIFFLFLMPLGFVFLFSFIPTGGSGPEEVRVTMPVVDRDGDFLAVAFAEQLAGESFHVPVHDAAAADTLDFGTRFVTIPDSFTRRVLAGEKSTVTMTADAASNVSFDLAAEVRVHQAQVRFLGNLVRWAGVGDSTLAGPAGLNDPDRLSEIQKARFFELIHDPPSVTVDVSHAGRGRPVPQGTQQSIPGVLVMFVVMTVLIGGSEALTKEKERGTLRRLATTPLSAGEILLGKTLGLTLLGLTQALILVIATDALAAFGVGQIDFRWATILGPVAPTLIAYCICVASLGLLLSGLLRTPQQAESLAWLFGLGMSALGGAWWPLEIMPEPMKIVGRLFPTTWAMEGLHTIITFGQGVGATVQPVMVLLGMAVLFWVLGTRTLRVVD